MEKKQIDVLAVLNAFAWNSGSATRDDAADASAAVAELIEAGTAYDAAMCSEADTDGMLRRESARARLRAALARVHSS